MLSLPILTAKTVLAVADSRLKNWRHEAYRFENLMAWLEAARCVLLCISRSCSSARLSQDQVKSICSISHSILKQFEQLLYEQDWANLEPERAEVKEGRGGQIWKGTVPHRLSGLLVSWTIEPLTYTVESGEQAHQAVPRSLVSAVEQAWLAIERQFPSPIADLALIHAMHMDSGMHRIGPALNALRASVTAPAADPTRLQPIE